MTCKSLSCSVFFALCGRTTSKPFIPQFKCQRSSSCSASSGVNLRSFDEHFFCGWYSFLGCWWTLLVVRQSDHQSWIAWSGLKDFKAGPSTKISSRSSRVSPWRLVCWVVLNTFIDEKICSILPFENGKLKDNPHRQRMSGHFLAYGQEKTCTRSFCIPSHWWCPGAL